MVVLKILSFDIKQLIKAIERHFPFEPRDRQSPESFKRKSCRYTDKVNKNTAKVLNKKAIKLVGNSGAELFKGGGFFDSGREAKVRRGESKST
mgnify:CR=1 FL=1